MFGCWPHDSCDAKKSISIAFDSSQRQNFYWKMWVFFTNWRVSFKQIYFRNSSYVLNGNIAVGEILSMLKLTVKRYVLASWSTFKFRVCLGHSENLHLFSLSEAGLVRVSSDRCHCLTTNECLSVRSQTDSTFNLWEILLESRPALHTLKRWDRKKPRCT